MPRDAAPSTTEAGTEARFLDGLLLRPVSLPPGVPFTAVGLALGQGVSPLEVLGSPADHPVRRRGTLKHFREWKRRNG